MGAELDLGTLVTVAAVAVLAPIISDLPPGMRPPAVVAETALGIAIGPHVLGLVAVVPLLGFFGTLCLAFLSFMAGLELDLARIRGHPLRRAGLGWVMSVGLALAAGSALYHVAFVVSPLLIAVALSSTALGTILPILCDAGELQTRFGTYVLAAGSVGELGPIVLLSLLVTREHDSLTQTALLVTFTLVALVVALVAVPTARRGSSVFSDGR